MANLFINSSFTLRPSANDRDRPELTLRQAEVSRIPRETTVTGHYGRWGRAVKRQRLFMDQSLTRNDSSYHCYNNNNNNKYISEDENDTPIIRRRVACDFPSRHRICTGSSSIRSESNYWKSRCLGMQTFCDESKNRLLEAEEDQRQLRQRIRELEEQLLLQTSQNYTATSIDEGNVTNNQSVETVEGKTNRTLDVDMENTEHENTAPPALVIEIKETHQAVSSCFYMTDGEGLNESYDLEMEDEEDNSMNIVYSDGLLHDIDDDRNDISRNQQRG